MKSGFTTIELVLVIGISLLVIAAMLGGFVNFLVINEHNRNLTIAMNIARDKLEGLLYKNRSGDFDTIVTATYDKTILDTSTELKWSDWTGTHLYYTYGVGTDWGSCNVTVTSIDNNLKFARIVVCWKERGNRIIGEDTNLNGVLDSTEDQNGNGLLDSPCALSSAMARK